jgi:hypothetical protein
VFDIHIFVLSDEIALADFDDFQRNNQRNRNHSIVKKKIGSQPVQSVTEVGLGDIQIRMLALVIVNSTPKVSEKGCGEAQ